MAIPPARTSVPGPTPHPAMPHAAYVLPPHRLGLLRLSGDVDGPDLLQGIAALYTGQGWCPPFSAVWDLRGVTALDLLPDDVERLCEVLDVLRGRTAPPGRGAILTAREIDE